MLLRKLVMYTETSEVLLPRVGKEIKEMGEILTVVVLVLPRYVIRPTFVRTKYGYKDTNQFYVR